MKTVLLLMAAFMPFWAGAQKNKMAEVENNLRGWVEIKDSVGWNIQDRMKHYRINGLSIAVIENYKVAWAKGYGWADTLTKRRVTSKTLFQPASIGKSIHAVGVAQLATDGRLSLDSDINRYLKTWKFPYDSTAHGKTITVRQLLSHTAGLTVHGFDGYKMGRPLPTITQILDGLPPANNPAVRSYTQPGHEFRYSGGGYTISGLMVQDITGIPYAQYMRRSVLNPLGMHNTYYYGETGAKQRKNMATAYRYDGLPIGYSYHVYAEDACGASLWSTPTDIAKFIIEVQVALKNGSAILQGTMVQQLLTPVIGNSGMGFFIEDKNGARYFHHSGLNEGFVADYYASAEGGYGVVIMANTDLAANIDITEEIVNSVAKVYGWKNFYNPVVKEEVVPQQNLAARYVGSYSFNPQSGQRITVSASDSRLWFNDGANVWQMHFSAPGEFFFTEVPYNVHRFTFDASGHVDGFEVITGENTFKAVRVE